MEIGSRRFPADASALLPVPEGTTFAEASSITIQGITAYTMLKLAARLQPGESVLIQAAAGGVGVFLVQLAKALGAGQVIALASSDAKLSLLKDLGADVAINYVDHNWPDHVMRSTHGKVWTSCSSRCQEGSVMRVFASRHLLAARAVWRKKHS